MGAPDCQLLQRQKEPKTKEMRCGSSVWFESWQSFLTETRTPCYIPNCEVRTHKARAWRVLVTTSVCAAPWEVPGSLPNSFFFFWKLQYKAIVLDAEPGASGFTAVVLCKSHWRKGTTVHLPPGQSISTLPLMPELFFSEEVPEWVGCLPSFRGLFWFRLWKQLPNWNLTTITAPNEGDALFFLTTSGFAKGICPQTTRTWGRKWTRRGFHNIK